jgi:HSP20 family protein
VLKAEVPGLRREDIDLSVDNNTLTIKGERRRDEAVREDRYHRIERAYGPFSRSFTLPNTVDGGRVRAEYRDGVLTIVLPRRDEARPRQIQVEVKE